MTGVTFQEFLWSREGRDMIARSKAQTALLRLATHGQSYRVCLEVLREIEGAGSLDEARDRIESLAEHHRKQSQRSSASHENAIRERRSIEDRAA